MKKIFVILLLIVFLSFLFGCTSLDEGIVYQKNFTPAYRSTYYISSKMGSTRVVRPYSYYHPDLWEVCVEFEDKKDCWEVTESFYDSVEVGDHIYKPGKESK